MSELLDQFNKEFGTGRRCITHPADIADKFKTQQPFHCLNCSEEITDKLPTGLWNGVRFEPYCRECRDVVKALRKAGEIK